MDKTEKNSMQKYFEFDVGSGNSEGKISAKSRDGKTKYALDLRTGEYSYSLGEGGVLDYAQCTKALDKIKGEGYSKKSLADSYANGAIIGRNMYSGPVFKSDEQIIKEARKFAKKEGIVLKTLPTKKSFLISLAEKLTGGQ